MDEWKKNNPQPETATLKDLADHIDYVRKIAGIDHVGFGADFEGFEQKPPTGADDVSCYPAILAELLNRGYTPDEIKKVASGNILRVLRKAEQVSASLKAAKK